MDNHTAWVVNPDIITAAINSLVKAVWATLTFMGLSLIGTFLYIWKRHELSQEKSFEGIKTELKAISHDFKEEVVRMAHSLETISGTLFDRQRDIEIRMEKQETRCDERSKSYSRRTTDQEG